MPSSYTEGKQTTSKWLGKIQPKTALDLGPGCGTYEYIVRGVYGELLRTQPQFLVGDDLENNTFTDYIKSADCHMTGIEAYWPYVDTYGLKNRYQKIIVSDVRYVDWGKVVEDPVRGNYRFAKYDVGFAGDILEHMTVKEAKDVIANLKMHCENVIISIPIIHFEQGDIGGNPFEVHVEEDWTNEKIIQTFGTPKDSFIGRSIGVYLY